MTTKRPVSTATRPHGRVGTSRPAKAKPKDGACASKLASAIELPSAPLRVPVAKSRQRALMREYGLDLAPVSETEALRRREALETLVRTGRRQGFLTREEVMDQLPEMLGDTDALESTLKLLEGMGITLYERAPEIATLLLASGTEAFAGEEEAETTTDEAALAVEAALSRTTDPVRLYMRGVGSFDLLWWCRLQKNTPTVACSYSIWCRKATSA